VEGIDMNPYYLVSLCVMVTAGIGLIVFEVLLLLDNKKFWDSIDKQRYGCYNKEEKARREKQC
jgi:hypothetical protein